MSGGRLLRYSLAGLCIALAAFFLLPLAIGAHHIGMFFPAAVLGVLAWMLLRPQKLKMLLTGKGRILWRSLLALFAAGLLCVAVILGLMARQAADRPEAVGPCTVLVLGCEVRGLRPSKMLAARIDSAYDYLTANPEAVCVACGGIGGLYKNSTNFPHITGDAIAMALRHGVACEHLDYIQIHPTTLYSHRKGRRFLISESVRGEGALLLDKTVSYTHLTLPTT